MRLVTWAAQDPGKAAVLTATDRHVTVRALNARLGTCWPDRVEDLLAEGLVPALADWTRTLPAGVLASLAEPSDPLAWGPLFQPTGKIWGIGLNYGAHADDLGAARPDEPASFMRPWDTVSHPGQGIRLPSASQRVTAEAELGLVIGRRARQVEEATALECVAGAVAVLDLTAEDILQRNPRFLTRAKSFDSFFSFGPVLATLDELGELASVRVATVVNDRVIRDNTVDHMLFSPAHLIAFHSQVFAWQPGDILSTGTPGAGVIQRGDIVKAEVGPLPPLVQKVVSGG